MIVSASYRTDIPAYYGAWFRRRLAEGFCRVTNPYGGAAYRVPLTPDEAEAFAFWTRNVGPFMGVLDELAEAGRPFVVQFTITGYPRALEPGVLDTDTAAAQVEALAARFGRRAVVWRYDPVVTSSLTPAAFHRENFALLARRLVRSTDEVVLSFAHGYKKMLRNMTAASLQHRFTWDDPAPQQKRELLADLAAIAAGLGIKPSLCAQPDLLVPGVSPARCIDGGRLSEVAGRPIAARQKGNRPACDCAESRDIGAYDSCAQGCAYCYAVRDRATAQARLKAHVPDGEFLIAPAQAAGALV
ncbi:MAG TPA: DUF1848 domain-containing protein [Candidatus Cybelea sp.]|nr:DUF1848 domain-containing protein [Candidatus Cybelea sp.]